MRRLALVIALLAGSCSSKPDDVRLDFAIRHLSTVESEFRIGPAMETIRYLTRFWRLAGNEGFDSAAAYVAERLSESGYARIFGLASAESTFSFRMDTSKLDERLAWTPRSATLRIVGDDRRTVYENTYDRTPVMLTANSFPADLKNVVVVDIGDGSTENDFAGVDVRGRIVLGDAPATVLYLHAVKRHGAAGVLSAHVPEYNRPLENPDAVAEETIPLSESSASFALKISRNAAERIRTAMKKGSCTAFIHIDTHLGPSHLKTIIAEIRGRDVPSERIVYVAHLDHYKPGANDNASGAAALLEMASTLKRLIESGKLEPPARTITFLWVDEYQSEFHAGGVGYWSTAYPIEFAKTKAALALDMVGGDGAKTGGVFRLEKHPDPSAIWTRHPDEHSGWGASLIDEAQVKGSFINDYVWHVMDTHAKSHSWNVHRNPFEGGSDHEYFIHSGIPSVLLWHFPDRYYHTDGDDIDKISPTELTRSSVVACAAALGLASLNTGEAETLAALVSDEGRKRLQQELHNSRQAIDKDGDVNRERRILSAWVAWYHAAILSVGEVTIRPDQRLLSRLSEIAREFQAFGDEIIHRL